MNEKRPFTTSVTVKVSRARACQLRYIAQGLCSHCGKNPLGGNKGYCDGCAEKKREAMRLKHGFKAWRKGRKGRPPKVKS